MPLRPKDGSQCPVRHTIPKRERLFRRMQQLSQDGMIAGQKLRQICQGDMNHGRTSQPIIPSRFQTGAANSTEPLSLNQADFMLTLRLFSRQIQQLV
jgi:hypothetical protein